MFFLTLLLSIAISWCFVGFTGYAAITVDWLRSATQPAFDAKALPATPAFHSGITASSSMQAPQPVVPLVWSREGFPRLSLANGSGVYQGIYVGKEMADLLRDGNQGMFCSHQNIEFGTLMDEYRACQLKEGSCSPALIRRKILALVRSERYRSVARIPFFRLAMACSEMRNYLTRPEDIAACDFG